MNKFITMTALCAICCMAPLCEPVSEPGADDAGTECESDIDCPPEQPVCEHGACID